MGDAGAMGPFRVLERCGGARTGLYKGMATPAICHFSRTAQVAHLTPEQTREHGVRALGVSYGEVHMLGELARARGEKLAQLAGHSGDVHLHVTLRQPAEYPLHASANDSRTIEMPAGRRKVTPEGFANAVAAVRPDSVSCLADEVPPHAGKKRLEKSVARTAKWLDAIVPALAGSGVDVFATVLGCGSTDARRAAARELAGKDVQGFTLGGLGLGESPADRAAEVRAMLAELPATKPRLLCVGGPLASVLQAVAEGVDLVQSDYAHELATEGHALVFDPQRALEASAAAVTGGEASEETARLGAKISLRDPAFKVARVPLRQGCGCYACQHHTRAYVHHLLDRHEMLGFALLIMHNTWTLEALMQRTRGHIADGSFGRLWQAVAGPDMEPAAAAAGE